MATGKIIVTMQDNEDAELITLNKRFIKMSIGETYPANRDMEKVAL